MSGSVANLTRTGAAGSSWNLTDLSWDLPATVTPGKMTFSNTGTNDHTLDGVGGIAGLGEGLVKNGDARVYLGGINTFAGPVQINSGLIRLLTPQALGFATGQHRRHLGDYRRREKERPPAPGSTLRDLNQGKAPPTQLTRGSSGPISATSCCRSFVR